LERQPRFYLLAAIIGALFGWQLTKATNLDGLR
jgi:hypothetical protein